VTPDGWAAWASPVVQARCVENGVFGLACNVQGLCTYAGVSQQFAGGALAVGPGGQVLARHTDETDVPHMLVADLDRDLQLQARAAFEYTFRFRRPELYGLLAKT
jgi:predicted amidohydrolase